MTLRGVRRLSELPGRAEAAFTDVRNLRRLRTAARSGSRGIVEAPLVFLLAVLTIASGFLLLETYGLIVFNARSVLAAHASDLSLVAFLEPEAGQTSQRQHLAQHFGALDEVYGVAFVSPETALQRLRSDLGAEADVLEGLGHNPLPASFELTLSPGVRESGAVQDLVSKLSALPGVEEVQYGAAWLESYNRLLASVQWLGVGFGIVLVLVLGVIVAGTVRLAVYSRSDEIAIQRLVGAGGFYVRLPFYLEGALQGLLGAGLALLLLAGFYRLGLPFLGEALERVFGLSQLSFYTGAQVGALLFAGAAIGFGAAFLSLLQLDEAP